MYIILSFHVDSKFPFLKNISKIKVQNVFDIFFGQVFNESLLKL